MIHDDNHQLTVRVYFTPGTGGDNTSKHIASSRPHRTGACQ